MNPLLCLALAGSACGADIPVRNPTQLSAALTDAEPGDRILLAPGNYAGDFNVRQLHGNQRAPIVITAADPANPPVLTPVYTALHLSGASYVEISNLVINGFADNGLNIDDDGDFDHPAHHIVLRNLWVRGNSPGGNCDGIKLSGVDDVKLMDSTVEQWGLGGSGVDMVGCHRVLVGNCLFQNGGFNGVQVKGGSADVRVAANRFLNAGTRAVQAGGSTGYEYFRPRLETIPAGQRAEAYRVTVEGNIIAGGEAAVACCTADGVVVRQNTVYVPGKWFLRILQETTDPAFAPCRNAVVTDNIVVYRTTNWSSGGLNVGVLTAPQTFAFARNAWYCEDAPRLSSRTLPTTELKPVIGVNPGLVSPATGDFRAREQTVMRGKGYQYFVPNW